MSKSGEKVRDTIVKAEALVNLKYNEDCFEVGDEFKVNFTDAVEMEERGFIEVLEQIPIDEGETKEGES